MNLNTKSALIGLLTEEFCNDSIQLAQYRANKANSCAIALMSAAMVRENHFRAGGYDKEDLINSYSEVDFHRNFRMMKETFRRLIVELTPHYPVKHTRSDNTPVSLMKATLMTLYYLSRQLSMADIAEFFKVSPSTVCNEVHRVIKILCNISASFIKWPKREDVNVVERQFRELGQVPGAIGAIDGCHVMIEPPADQQDSYIDKKMNHSVLLQGICTAKKIFTDVSIGVPGRRHDVAALRYSAIYRKVQNEGPLSIVYEDQYHLLGDSGYSNRTWLISPYTLRGGPLTAQQRRFNYRHSKTRVVIENTFGLLKGRWRRLKKIFVRDVPHISDIILAACVLHNFCYLNGDKIIEEMEEPELVERRNPGIQYQMETPAEAERGKQKRTAMAALF